jgi:hypothetical protein
MMDMSTKAKDHYKKVIFFGFDGRPYEVTFVDFFEGLISYYIESFKLVPLTLHNIVYMFMTFKS